MSAPDFKEYVCEYPFAGAKWGFTIKAASFEDAEARLRALCWAHLNGELIATIPASVPAAGLMVRAACWLRNLIFTRETLGPSP